MPNTPSSSFIPRQGPAKGSRRTVTRQVHLFTVLSYVLFFGTLTATAGVFLYAKHTERVLRDEVVALDAAIANFSNEKMEQVRAFNARLIQAQNRISSSVSAVSIFESLEASTAQSVGIESLSLTRAGDEKFLITAEINTNTFDSALFQRGLYERNPAIETVAFEDVSLGDTDSSEEEVRTGVSFKAELEIPLAAVPYAPDGTAIPVTETTVVEIGTSTEATASSTESLSDNQEGV